MGTKPKSPEGPTEPVYEYWKCAACMKVCRAWDCHLHLLDTFAGGERTYCSARDLFFWCPKCGSEDIFPRDDGVWEEAEIEHERYLQNLARRRDNDD